MESFHENFMVHLWSPSAYMEMSNMNIQLNISPKEKQGCIDMRASQWQKEFRGHRLRVAPVEVGLQQCELSGDLDGVKGQEVKLICLSCFTQVPLDGRRRALERDVVTGAVGLSLFLPLDDLGDGLHPLSHGLTCAQVTGLMLETELRSDLCRRVPTTHSEISLA